MEMEIETKPTECEVCDNETRHYVRVKFGFGKGDLKVCSRCVREMHELMND
jgi:hypothetical protein